MCSNMSTFTFKFRKNSLWSLCGLSGRLSSFGSLSALGSVFAFRWSFFIFARWFWNQTWTTRTLSPVSLARASRTFLQGLGDSSNEALNCRRWADVRIVLGRFGPRRPSRGRLSSSRSSSVKEEWSHYVIMIDDFGINLSLDHSTHAFLFVSP